MTAPDPVRPDHPINDLVAKRWSPYAFSDRPVSADDLRSLFEAARWAPSSYNEQPWGYIVATKDNPAEFERVLSCLVPVNQAWAKMAPVLALGCTRLSFSRNGQPNSCALHDLGLASAMLCVEATSRGICVHQIGGILPDRAREIYGIPSDTQALTGIAIGYAADKSNLPPDVAARDNVRRGRKPIADFLFTGKWADTSDVAR